MFQYYKLFDYMRKNNIRQKDLLDKKIISNICHMARYQNMSLSNA